MNKKYLFIYFTHIWNDDIRQRYNDVSKAIHKCKDVDILLMYADIIDEDLSMEINDKCLIYNNGLIYDHYVKTFTNYPFIDPFCPFKKIYQEHKEYFNNYDYIYIWEYDQWYAGDLTDYINELNKDNSDLIASYIDKLNNDSKWVHYAYYREVIKRNYCEELFSEHLKSCLSFCRISLKYLDMMFSDKYNKITDIFLYELYVPTIIYNNGGVIKSISIGHNEFDFRDDLNSETFFCSLEFKTLNEMKELQSYYDHPMLYTRWK